MSSEQDRGGADRRRVRDWGGIGRSERGRLMRSAASAPKETDAARRGGGRKEHRLQRSPGLIHAPGRRVGPGRVGGEGRIVHISGALGGAASAPEVARACGCVCRCVFLPPPCGWSPLQGRSNIKLPLVPNATVFSPLSDLGAVKDELVVLLFPYFPFFPPSCQ